MEGFSRSESRPTRRGVLDAADRVLRRLIDRPGLKSAARHLANSLDPESSRAVVRTVMWRDPDLLFTAVGALPKLANSLITAADEALEQIEAKLTPTMRSDLTEALLDDIDWETLERVIRRGRRLVRELAPLLDRHRSHLQEERA